MRQFLIACLFLVAPAAVLAEVTYTYTGPSFWRANAPYDTSMRVSGSFTLPDHLDQTPDRLSTIVPVSYSFSDGVYDFDETNSQITVYVAVDASGLISYWNIDVTNGPRQSDTDFAEYGFINTGTNNNDYDSAHQEYCHAASTDICLVRSREAYIDVVRNGFGSWAVSGTGLPEGANTILNYSGQALTPDFDGEPNPFYGSGNRVTGTVQIPGMVTPGATYTDGGNPQNSNNIEIEHFEFTDGVNTFNETNSYGCFELGYNTRVLLKFDEDDGSLLKWQACMTNDSQDGTFAVESGSIRTNKLSEFQARDTVVKYICDDYDPVADSCTYGSSPRLGSASNTDMPGSWTITLPPLLTDPEVCDNSVDDDGDGLIDEADPDCAPPPIGLQVRCMHEPIYPQPGDVVTITVEGIDSHADPVSADSLKIFINDRVAPYEETLATPGGHTVLQTTLTASGGSFGYGCTAEAGSEFAVSWRAADPRLRSVDIGAPENEDWAAIPVLYNGPTNSKIDIVFFHDDDEYSSYLQPEFLEDVHEFINEGLWQMAWFVEHQWAFNIWIARADGADASPESETPPNQTVPHCNRKNTNEIRNIFNKKYKFRDVGAVVHTSDCRDNANVPRTFTVQADNNRPLVVAHEMGHKPFGMKDEYCRVPTGSTQLVCDGGHGQNNPFANQYKTEKGCRDSAEYMPYEPDDCRLLLDEGKSWWLGEPRYTATQSASQRTPDLMQQTGARESIRGSGDFDIEDYEVGKTEIRRMNWLIEKCLEEKC